MVDPSSIVHVVTQHHNRCVTCLMRMLSAAAALPMPLVAATAGRRQLLQRPPADDGDGNVLLQLEDDNTDLDSLADQVGRKVTDCTRLPVQGWASCKLAPAAASPEAAEELVATLRSVKLVMGRLGSVAGFGAGEQPWRNR